MKQYVILVHSDRMPIITSTNSLDYPVLLMAGYSVLFEGNKRECERLLEMEGAMAD